MYNISLVFGIWLLYSKGVVGTAAASGIISVEMGFERIR